MDVQSPISRYLDTNVKLFKITGLWCGFKSKSISKLVLIYSILVQVLFILSPQICHVIYMYRARNNVKDFADEFYVSLSSIVVVFKDFSLMKNFDTVKGMVDTMDMKMMQPTGDKQKRKFHDNGYMEKNLLDIHYNLHNIRNNATCKSSNRQIFEWFKATAIG
nr:unnamed protein product [Callosobruchus chinensis]